MNVETLSRSRAARAFETLRRTLADIGWRSDSDESDGTLYVDFGPPHRPVADALAAILFDSERFVFYVNCAPAAKPERRCEVAQFLGRANWGLIMGNFELDDRDGHVRFKSSVDFRNVELSEALIRNAILSAMTAVERYAGPLIAVIEGEKDATVAIRDAEAESN